MRQRKLVTEIYLMAIVFMVLCMGRVASAGYSWQQTNGPYGGFVSSLALDPSNSKTLFAATYGGVFKTTNGGKNWAAVNRGMTTDNIDSLVTDPNNGQTVYAGAGGAVFKTTDGGENWVAVNNGLPESWVYDLAIAPDNSQTLYAGTYDGVFKTVDGGATWTVVNSGLTSVHVSSLAISPTNNQIVYVGTFDGGVFKSVNGGATWSAVNSGLTHANVTSLAIDPTNSQTVYAGSWGGGLFKTIDGGMSWMAVIDGSLNTTYVETIAIDPADCQIVYVGTYFDGVLKTTDGGTTWMTVKSGLTSYNVSSIVIDPGNDQHIYAGTSSGVFASTNGGTDWSADSQDMIATSANSIAVDPSGSHVVFAGTGDGLFRTGDYGSSWVSVNDGLTYASIYSLAIDPKNALVVYAGTWGSGLFKTVDGGTSWINTGLSARYVIAIAIDPGSSQTVYAGAFDGVFKSGDGGTSWTAVNNGLPITDTNQVTALALDHANSSTIYAGTSAGGLFKSIDGGASWTTVNIGVAGVCVTTIAVDPANSEIVFVDTLNDGVFVSNDGGMSWTVIISSTMISPVRSFIFDPANKQVMYAGTYFSGVFKSSDNGTTWAAVSDGLTNQYIRSLAIDPTDSKTLYAGTENGGVFKLLFTPDPPGKPTGVAATAGNGQATVSFTPPTDNGGSPITGYTVMSSPGNKLTNGYSSPITVTGLTNGRTYTFTVTATNAVGTGATSLPSNSVTPMTAPGAPTVVSAIAGDGQATVVFTPPADNGGSVITGYTVTTHPDNKKVTGKASPITVTGLTNGVPYSFTVSAVNAAGEGASSDLSNVVTPTASLLINDGNPYTTNAEVSLTMSRPGAAAMQLSTNGSDWSAWREYAASSKLSLPRGDGLKTVAVRFRGKNGVVSPVYSATITLDTHLPKGSMTLNGGARYTNSRTVSLEISASDATSGIAGVCLKESSLSCSDGEFEPFIASKTFTIEAPGDGKKTIHATLRNLAGKTSKTFKSTIILDTVAPVGSLVINGGKAVTDTQLVTIKLKADKASEMMLSLDGGATWGGWEKFVPSKKVTLAAGAENLVQVRFRDLAGNESGVISAATTIGTEIIRNSPSGPT